MTTQQKLLIGIIIVIILLVLASVAYFLGLFGGNSEEGAPGAGGASSGAARRNSGSGGFGSGSGLRVGSSTFSQASEPDPSIRKSEKVALHDAMARSSNAASGMVVKKGRGKLTLERRLRYGGWTIPPTIFYGSAIVISIFAVGLASLKLNIVWTILSVLTGPIVMNSLLNASVNRRFKAFDTDYAQFLLSVVALIKTGMNPMTGLETAAKGLSEFSALRAEVEMMIERLRFGVPEDKSIGAFGEDIYHPEIELFVQALLLSMRVGGTLSDTLERLAKQVRKRQFFRESANAAVGLQRGSIWFILLILTGLETYLYFIYPESIVGALKDEVGWQVWQFGILAIVAGMFWVRQVTKIKV